jgi:2-oxoisovalerate dehydrogenase E2 component (dihydrolipoyl transacylase)
MAVREFLLPDLGEGLEDAEVVTWRVTEGDRVELNQTLVEVNTAKALVEIPAPWEGVVEKLHAAEGAVVRVGEPLVSIRVEDTATTAGAGEADASTEAPPARPKRQALLVGYGVEEEEVALAPAGRPPAQGKRDRAEPVRASPPVRRLAKELGVDLASVRGSGPDGRVTREDVLGSAEQVTKATAGVAPTSSADTERIPVKGTRRLIAEKMTRAAREVPQVTTFLTVDATARWSRYPPSTPS